MGLGGLGRKEKKKMNNKKRKREVSVGNDIFPHLGKWFRVNYPRLVKQGGGEVGHIIRAVAH